MSSVLRPAIDTPDSVTAPRTFSIPHTARSVVVLPAPLAPSNPDNVGSIIRSSAAMGVRGALIGPECADPFYRKAIRTSMGAALTANVLAAEPWPEMLDQLKASGHTVVAATPDPSAPDIDAVAAQRRPGDSLVLLVGSEGEGLTMEARRAADVEARIPMSTIVDSLNVAVATAVAVYALTRRKTS